LKYTKYSCEKPASSERDFSQDSLSPDYAVLPLGKFDDNAAKNSTVSVLILQ